MKQRAKKTIIIISIILTLLVLTAVILYANIKILLSGRL